ncbi:MAG: hypothetical protein EBZ48_18010, partial [Proteobacteria bacterium]|nr:hypothetical protein [Pseudomonadota bacterium]
KAGFGEPIPKGIGSARTEAPVNPLALKSAVEQSKIEAKRLGFVVSDHLWERYGAASLEIVKLHQSSSARLKGKSGETPQSSAFADPDGFPALETQLRYAMKAEMVVHLSDFYLRRIPLYLSRVDHGLPWLERLAQVWAEERGLGESEMRAEIERTEQELKKRSEWLHWLRKLPDPPVKRALGITTESSASS